MALGLNTESKFKSSVLMLLEPDISTASTGDVSPPRSQPLTLLALLLSDQQDLSAVEHFSIRHEANDLPAQAKYYRSLIPATPPGPGQQYAFDVDLDRCSGCKACVAACHSLNGLDQNETWRDVGMLIGGTTSNPVMQHVTTACHHCVEPACLNACPVDAYEKDVVTGIVKHLDDQCFGCQYCTLACPYDVPKYHAAKGIVRKCDMCSSRLAVGEAPACVQSCPHEAISIRIIDRQQVIDDSEAALFLPAAPDPQITLPTTTYRTKRVFPRNLLPVDYHSVSAQHPHWPLIIMLVLTQLSVGAFMSALWLERWLAADIVEGIRPLHSLTALVFGLLALAASTLHLGRPQYAFRAIVGLRHSWLSREIVAFGVFAKLAVLYAVGNWLAPEWLTSTQLWRAGLGWSVGLSGLIGVGCSIMIYAVTQRPLWGLIATTVRFSLTSGLLGLAALWLTTFFLSVGGSEFAAQVMSASGERICQALVWLSTAKLLFEASLFRHLLTRQMTPLRRSARLMLEPFRKVTIARFICGVIGGIVMPLFLQGLIGSGQAEQTGLQLTVMTLLFVACLVGELLERFLFFGAVAAPRMPGALRS